MNNVYSYVYSLGFDYNIWIFLVIVILLLSVTLLFISILDKRNEKKALIGKGVCPNCGTKTESKHCPECGARVN